MTTLALQFQDAALRGDAQYDDAPAPLAGGRWLVGRQRGDGLEWAFAAGTLAGMNWLTADFLLDGLETLCLALEFQEGEGGPVCRHTFSLLPQCQARMRAPLACVDMRQLSIAREGAYLKPRFRGLPVDLARVDRLRLGVHNKSDPPARWCLTPPVASAGEPAKLTDPMLPRGVILDALGQSAQRDWPTKTRSADEVTARLRKQLADSPRQAWPAWFGRWGGWTRLRFDATGFFRTHHDGGRWWLVDPDGLAFWSAGVDCVRPDTDACCQTLEKALADPAPAREGFVNYLRENFIRAFGADDWQRRWATITLAHLRAFGFNTMANWSQWAVAREAGMPYVRALEARLPRTPRIFRDLPDVFSPDFAADAAEFAAPLAETRDAPGLLGYFLMNEPKWGFAQFSPIQGVLMQSEQCHTRKALRDWLAERCPDDRALAERWGMDVSFERVERGRWTQAFSPAAQEDLLAFSVITARKLFETLSAACRAVDPNHLNLGARYYTMPPEWVVQSMGCFDVFSMNYYAEQIRKDIGGICQALGRPALIGEFHFGALDAGLPASGIGRVRDQAQRGQAYRRYVEDAAAQPWCVGAHWFMLYDQSAMGRHDGECYNIGFLDACNRPYEPLAQAARAAHERIYEVAAGQAPPYEEAPEYLPQLFL